MFQDIGQRIRIIRSQKGIGLNEFAKELGVSAGYLSNLENGKTETIELSLLEKLQEELALLPLPSDSEAVDEWNFRLQRAASQLQELAQHDSHSAHYLLESLERGIDWFSQKKR
jgi:transcriptional regulator with XRE-family HTH domain